MNERIKELAEQAGAIKCHGYVPHPKLDGHLFWAADAALDTKKMDALKFAKLIVQECAKTIRGNLEKYPHGDLTWRCAMEESAKVVSEHFGVTE